MYIVVEVPTGLFIDIIGSNDGCKIYLTLYFK